MLSVTLDNGITLKALDLGKEIQLRVIQQLKGKQNKETWKVIEKSSPAETFPEAARKQFAIFALSEKTRIQGGK